MTTASLKGQRSTGAVRTGDGGADIEVVRHDARHVEWRVGIPVPDHGDQPYLIEADIEVPSQAASPSILIQAFTRLDGGGPNAQEPAVGTLQRAVASVQRLLKHARVGFERHCQVVTEQHGPEFLATWFDAALHVAAEARAKLSMGIATDSPMAAHERALVDEFLSVELLEAMAEAARLLRSLGTAPGAAEVRATLASALRDEMAYRKAHDFLRCDGTSAVALEVYAARVAMLKARFQPTVFLDRDTWPTTALAPWVRIRERTRAWMTGKPYRYEAAREVRCRIPVGKIGAGDVVVRAREWDTSVTRTTTDPLGAATGANLVVTNFHQAHQGVQFLHAALRDTVRNIVHVFRMDLSAFLPNPSDEVRVPLIDREGQAQTVAVPRPLHIPVSIRARCGEAKREALVTVVLDKSGVKRVDAGLRREIAVDETLQRL